MGSKNTENLVEVTAKINLKYDSDVKSAGEKFQVRESDLKELQDKGYIDYKPPANQTPNNNQTTPPANTDVK